VETGKEEKGDKGKGGWKRCKGKGSTFSHPFSSILTTGCLL